MCFVREGGGGVCVLCEREGRSVCVCVSVCVHVCVYIFDVCDV